MMHNCALYIIVKFRDKLLAQVLIMNGLVLNICPVSIVTQLVIDVGKILQNRMNVTSFDGAQRETIWEVDLCIQTGPAEFVSSK